MQYGGFYLNLERDADRRQRLEAQLAHYNLREVYRRFAAAEGNVRGFPKSPLTDGEIGCFTSHYSVLEHHAGAGLPLHVVEDDVVFSRFTHEVVAYAAAHMLDDYDLLFTDVAFDLAKTNILDLVHARRLFEQHVTRDRDGNPTAVTLTTIPYTAGASSYIVNPRSIPRLLAIYHEALASADCPPFDLLLKRKADEQRIRVACLFPFVTSVQPDADTTIADRQHDALGVVASDLIRAAFFVDADLKDLRASSRDRLPFIDADPSAELIGRAVAYFVARGPAANG